MIYYNEHDPRAAAWLRELMQAGQIPQGDVDERSIEVVRARELHGYTQCHFFAGIGGVGLLRGYGNAIVPELAAEFIIAAEEARAMMLERRAA